jgi:hypothetical protein
MEYEVDAQPVRLQLDRILASTAFADAGRASSFLRFVVERTLASRHGEIKESVIAVEVLSRPPSFDSKSDPIVRVEAERVQALIRRQVGGNLDPFGPGRLPRIVRLLERTTLLGRRRTRFLGIGVRPEHVKTADIAAGRASSAPT